jgi:hypothetical protein
MAGYTPVFDSVFDGTLGGRWPTLPVWLSLLPLADKNGEINLTPQQISARTGWPLDLLTKGIDELMQPDAESRSKVEDGRRLVLIDPDSRSWGWYVVNHERYREKARKQAYDAQRTASGDDAARKAAARSKCREVPACPAKSRDLPLSNADTNADTNAESITAAVAAHITNDDDGLLALKVVYPLRAGSQPMRRAIKAIHARLEEGHTWEEIIAGARRYAAHCDAMEKTGTEFVMQLATFCGPDKHFLQPWSFPVKQHNGDKKLKWRPPADEDDVPK